MKDVKLQLVIGFLILGAALLGVSYYFSKKKSNGLSGLEIRLAQVNRETGKVYIFKGGSATRESIDRKTALYSLDSVETSEDGSSMVTTEGGDRVLILGNSLVTIEKADQEESFSTVLILKRGELRIESVSKEGDLAIAKNGERILANDYNGSQLAKAMTQLTAPIDTFSNPLSEENLGLTENEITSIMNSQRNSFFKCYTQLLQKEPTAHGDVSLSFTIENSGKLSVAEVTASSIPNKDFKNCLLEVLNRLEFKPFKGTPISTLFPLKFE